MAFVNINNLDEYLRGLPPKEQHRIAGLLANIIGMIVIADPVQAGYYRRSFEHYTANSLLLSSFFYAVCSAFLIGEFLIKYKIELLLSFPFFAVLFTWYLAIGLKSDSAAQAPEKLYREAAFMGFAALTFAVVLILFVVDIPILDGLMRPYYIPLGH